MPVILTSYSSLVRLVVFTAVFVPRAVAGQVETLHPRESPTVPVAVLPVALYTAQANVQQPSDSTKAALATEVLLARLQELPSDPGRGAPPAELAALGARYDTTFFSEQIPALQARYGVRLLGRAPSELARS